MKKILLLISLLALVFSINAQDTILGTYLPVVNTEIKQVWIHSNVPNGPDINTFPLPTVGLVQGGPSFWDYSSFPASITTGANANTYSLKTYHPDSSMVQTEIGSHLSSFLTPGQHEAAQVSNWESPITGFSNVWTVSLVNDSGLYYTGHVNASNAPFLFDIKMEDLNGGMTKQLSLSSYIDVNTHKFDTTVLVTGLPINPNNTTPNPVVIKRKETRELEIIGWGSLKTPIDSVGGVLLGRELVIVNTKTYDNPSGTMDDTLINETNFSLFRYYFLRNNTFATSLLMQFNTDTMPSSTAIDAWYTIPSSVGSIEGIVYDTINGTTPVQDGEVLLFREHGNFTRDDVLARADIDTDGSYKFEKIPYGFYRLAARATQVSSGYDTEQIFLSYFEDTTAQNNPSLGVDWRFCDLVKTTTASTTGKDIFMRHESVGVAVPNEITGDIFRYEGQLKQGGDDPIPGIDIIVKEETTLKPIMSTTTASNGEYSLSNIPDGSYKLWVDVPGLGMESSYSFSVSAGVINRCEFDFDIGDDDIFREDYNTTTNGDCFTGIKADNMLSDTYLKAYPNPFSHSVSIELELVEKTNVSVTIYDITGKLISLVANKTFSKGVHVLNVNSIKTTGLYFAKVTIGNQEKTIRLIKL